MRLAVQDCLLTDGHDIRIDESLSIVFEDLTPDSELQQQRNDSHIACLNEVHTPFLMAQFDVDRELKHAVERRHCHNRRSKRRNRLGPNHQRMSVLVTRRLRSRLAACPLS